jgi:hypothetical protein
MKAAVDISICQAFIRKYLSGYRGYPATEAGEKRFAEAIQLNAVSVEHAEETLRSFDDQCPTVREIHDVAQNLKPRFLPKEDTRAEWEKQFGKPIAFDKYPSDVMAMNWQAFRDVLYYNEGPGRFEIPEPDIQERNETPFWVRALWNARAYHADSLQDLRQQVSDYGWKVLRELKESPRPFRYTRPVHAPQRHKNSGARQITRAPITQSDIDEAERERRNQIAIAEAEREPEEVPEAPSEDPDADTWDDPDR